MPMNPTLLSTEMENAIEAATDPSLPALDAAGKAARKKMLDALAQAIVLHIQINAGIVGVAVLPGLATGPGGGPVAGILSLPPLSIK